MYFLLLYNAIANQRGVETHVRESGIHRHECDAGIEIDIDQDVVLEAQTCDIAVTNRPSVGHRLLSRHNIPADLLTDAAEHGLRIREVHAIDELSARLLRHRAADRALGDGIRGTQLLTRQTEPAERIVQAVVPRKGAVHHLVWAVLPTVGVGIDAVDDALMDELALLAVKCGDIGDAGARRDRIKIIGRNDLLMVALPLQCAVDRCTVCRLLAAAARGENRRRGDGRRGKSDFLPVQHGTLPLSPPSRPPAAESLCPIIHQSTPTFKASSQRRSVKSCTYACAAAAPRLPSQYRTGKRGLRYAPIDAQFLTSLRRHRAEQLPPSARQRLIERSEGMTLHDEVHRPVLRQLVEGEERHDILAVPAHRLRRTRSDLLARRECIHRMPRVVGNRRRIVAAGDEEIVLLHRLHEEFRRRFSAEMPIARRIVHSAEHDGEIEHAAEECSRTQYACIPAKEMCRQDRRWQEGGKAVGRVLRRHKLKEHGHDDCPDEKKLRPRIEDGTRAPRPQKRERQGKTPWEHPEEVDTEIEVPHIPLRML